jgi:hypothetical protein
MLTLLLATATFKFPGGTTAELATALHEATQKPVVILDEGKPKLRAAEFDWAEPKDAKEQMRRTFVFTVSAGDALGFGGQAWPASMLHPGAGGRPASGGSFSLQEGKVTAVPVKGAVLSVSQINLSKPVRTHWFLTRAPLAIAAKEAPEAEVVQALAAALGAEMKQEGEYDLQPIPAVFKQRLVGGYSTMAKTDKDATAASRWVAASAVLQAMPPKEVQELYAAPGQTKTIEARPGSALFVAAWNVARSHVRALRKAEDKGGAAAQLEKGIDPTKPVQVEFSTAAPPVFVFADQDGKPKFRV